MPRSLAFTVAQSLGMLLALGCGGVEGVSTSGDSAEQPRFTGQPPMRIVCTTGPVAELVRRVGGPHVAVEALMGPGVDPHLYSPVASDVGKLAAADAIVYNGLHLEGRMVDVFERMARSKLTFAVTEGLRQRRDKRLREPPEFEGLYDPHVWHDPRIWADCAADVAERLARFDPPRGGDYRRSAEIYREELTELDRSCRAEIDRIPPERRVLVTAHDAFGYLGAAYGLEVHGLKGVSTEEEKDLARQEAIQQMLVERQIPAVFVESAVAPRTVAALVEPCRAAGLDLEIGGELYADAFGPPEGDAAVYAGMMRHNVRTIAEALQ